MSENETIADIVAEMRNTRFYKQTNETMEHWMRHFADRIEAAEKRETMGKGEARVWCVNDPTRKCVDCEICAGEEAE